jgi:hypothetical protein
LKGFDPEFRGHASMKKKNPSAIVEGTQDALGFAVLRGGTRKREA